MAHSELDSSITYKQVELLTDLVKRHNSHHADWFADLKEDEANIHQLSQKEASDYISELLNNEDSGSDSKAPREKGQITEKQRNYLNQLVRATPSFNESWFDSLKTGQVRTSDLDSQTASKYISALRDAQPVKEDGDNTREIPLRTPQQLELILKLLEEKELVRDSMIDVDALLERLTARAASKFIDTLKALPVESRA